MNTDNGQNPMKDENGMLTQIAVAVGRIEEKVSRIEKLEDRIANLEQTTTILKAQQPTKTPWFSWVGGLSSITAIILATIAILNIVMK